MTTTWLIGVAVSDGGAATDDVAVPATSPAALTATATVPVNIALARVLRKRLPPRSFIDLRHKPTAVTLGLPLGDSPVTRRQTARASSSAPQRSSRSNQPAGRRQPRGQTPPLPSRP